MAHFVEVPAEALEKPLQALGFRRTESYGQVVYVKPHDCCQNVLGRPQDARDREAGVGARPGVV